MPKAMSDRVAEIAAHLYAQHMSTEPYKGFEGTHVPIDLEEAYAVQFAFAGLVSSLDDNHPFHGGSCLPCG